MVAGILQYSAGSEVTGYDCRGWGYIELNRPDSEEYG